jgi:hypothetical protein
MGVASGAQLVSRDGGARPTPTLRPVRGFSFWEDSMNSHLTLEVSADVVKPIAAELATAILANKPVTVTIDFGGCQLTMVSKPELVELGKSESETGGRKFTVELGGPVEVTKGKQ